MKVGPVLLDGVDAGGGGPGAEKGYVDQIEHRLRRVAEAVDQLVDDIVGILLGTDGSHAAVEVHPLLGGGNVTLVDIGLDGEITEAFGLLDPLLALGLQYGVLQELEIHVIADAEHMARLFGAQQVARPPDFQVAHGDFEARQSPEWR